MKGDRATRYGNALVCYMTGTGNSYRAAQWVGEAVRAQGTPVRVVPVQEGHPGPGAPAGGRSLLGLVNPTHGFTAPWPVIRFALRLPRGRGAHAFVLPTRAGLKIGGLYTPGMEGTAGYLIALILLLKGYRVRGVMGLDMPSNWMSIHPGLKPASVQGISARARRRAGGFIGRILRGGRSFPPGSLVQLLFGLVLAPVSAGYLLVGRFFLAKLFFASERCNGCGVCAENCPSRAVVMRGRRNPRPYWTFSCESCMRCMAYCPRNAVEAGHSLGLLLYLAASVPAGVALLDALGPLAPGAADATRTWAHWLLQYPYTLLSMYLCYRLVDLLIRVPVINRLFTWTTLTRGWRRYHEPETGLKEIRVRAPQALQAKGARAPCGTPAPAGIPGAERPGETGSHAPPSVRS